MALQQCVCCFTVVIISLCKGCHSEQPACGSRAVKSSSITGGQHATPESWPWYAEVNSLFGGSLITDQWVLTTASITLFDFSSIEVYLGRHSKSGSNPNEVNRSVVNFTCHPEFNSSTHENDICLLKLSAPVNFTDYIQPICLASENSTFDNETSSWVISFGDDGNDSLANTLQEVRIKIVENFKCKFIYEDQCWD
ncbi:prostasin-like [Oreochromis aureus]|nr:prostasin-like [Oreochromis aureus]